MAVPTIIPTDVHVGGTLSAESIRYPSASVTNEAIIGSAGISASKQEGWFYKFDELYVEGTRVNPLASRMLHTVRGTSGTLLSFAGIQQTVATSTAELWYLDLQRQTASTTWVTILTTQIAFASSDAARVPKVGTFSTAALVSGDSLRCVVTTTMGAGSTSNYAQGIGCLLKWSETYT